MTRTKIFKRIALILVSTMFALQLPAKAFAEFDERLLCEPKNLQKSTALVGPEIRVELDNRYRRARISDEVINESGANWINVSDGDFQDRKVAFTYKYIVNKKRFRNSYSMFRNVVFRFALNRETMKFSVIYVYGFNTNIRVSGRCRLEN